MKTRLLTTSIFCFASIFASVAGAGLYKGLDEEGNVIYSDQPFDNAEEFTPPSLTIVDAPKSKIEEKPVENSKQKEFKYKDFDIVSPINEETIWNNPDINVTLKLSPLLNIAEGHSVSLIMDGKAIIENSQDTALRIGRINRGAHQLQGLVKDKTGKIVARTRVTTIYVKQTSVQN